MKLKEYILLNRHIIEKQIKKQRRILKYQLENWDKIRKYRKKIGIK